MIAKFDTGLISDGDSILVGLSGGADSVSLLLNLCEIKNIKNLEIKAVHINHCLRGQDSDNDQIFCEKLCKILGVTLFCEKLQVSEFCKQNNYSLEEGARILRYQVFEKYRNDGKVATAHNLSDNAETIIFNLTRGTGIKGLCGIPKIRDNIIRPMLRVSRQEILSYLKENGQDFVTDKTNFENEYSRNKIRNEVIPILSEINAGVCNSISNTSDILAVEEDYLDIISIKAYKECEMSEISLNYNIYKLNHKALRRRILKKFFDNNNISVSYKLLGGIDDNIMQNNNYKVNLTRDIYFICKGETISIQQIKNEKHDFFIKACIGNNEIIDKIAEVSIIDIEQFFQKENVNKKFAICYFDYDKIQGDIVFRNRRQGDKIHFEGKDFTTSVKKLFNAKVPLDERDKKVFVCDDKGIIYIENFGICNRVCIDDTTNKIVQVIIR